MSPCVEIKRSVKRSYHVRVKIDDAGLQVSNVDGSQVRIGGQKEVKTDLLLVFPHGQLVVYVAGLENLLQQFLNLMTDFGVEPVPWHDDHDQSSPMEGIRAQSHSNIMPLHGHDRANVSMELARFGPE